MQLNLWCLIHGGHRWEPIAPDEWLPRDHSHQTVRLLRFEQCPHCRTTRSTITSPEIEECRLSMPATLYPKEPSHA